MALAHSPRVVTNGLVFYYDINNTLKSWKGAPTVNLASGNFFDGNNNFSVDQNVSDIMPDGSIGIARDLDAQTIVDPNRTVSIGNYSLTAGSTYTLSFYAKNINCTGFGGNLYSPTLGRSISGISYPALNISNYVRVVKSFTVPVEGPDPVIVAPQVFRDGGIGKFRLTWLMLEELPFASTYTSTSRSTSQAILDLTNNNTIITNSLTYDTNNTFSFNGSSDYVSVSNAINVKTIIAWCKLSTAAGGDYVIYGPNSNGSDNWFGINGNKLNVFATQSADINNFRVVGTTTINTTSYYQLCCTIDTNTVKVFVNGNEEASTTAEFTIGSWNATSDIGRRGSLSQRYFPGNIDNIAVFDRVLTSSEIRQNFNALRGRFGI